MLLTAKFGGPNNAIFEYLSFGSTITSLVLSILAIFVTVQSSSDLYKQFARIDNATDTINSVSKQIEGTLSEIKKVEKDLSKASQNISYKMENIVECIDEKIRTHIKASEDNLTKIFNAPINNNDPVNNNIDTQTENQKQYIQNFIQITSANGLLVLYACALSEENEKIFEISELFKGNEGYTFGFMIASISAGLVIFTHDASNNQITVRQIVFRKDELYDEIKTRIKQQQLGTDYVNKVNDINSYFEVEPLNVTVK